jgi:hypothetical protein
LARTLYLHLGPAKTGTSAVQHILSRHDGSVILYPQVGLWPDGSHHNLVLNFFGDYHRPDVIRESPDRLLAEIGREARASDRDMVISSEILAGRRDLDRFITALQAAIEEECRVVAVVVAREHRERAASLYNQRVKDAVIGETREPDAFFVDHPERFCYNNVLRRLQKCGLEIVVLDYHPAGDFLARCLTLFGFPPDQIPPAPRRNISLGRLALVCTLAANQARESREDRTLFDAILGKIPGQFAEADALFSKTAVAAVRDVLASDRKFLRKQFGVKFPKPPKPEQISSLTITPQEFADMSAAIEGLGAYGERIKKRLQSFVRKSLQENAHLTEIEQDRL